MTALLRPALVLTALLAALPAAAQPAHHPFGGELLDLAAEAEAIRSGETAEARRAASKRFLETLYKDPHLAELGPRMGLERFVNDMAEGRAFDAAAFRAAAKDVVATHPNTTVDVGVAELRQKLDVVELTFTAPRSPAAPARGPPIDADAFTRHGTTGVLGSRDTRVMPMELVPGARVSHVSEVVAVPPGGISREAVALDLYGRMLATGGGRGELRGGLAHREVGRAVLSAPLLHPLGAETADVLKGVGPTPWAAGSNRFNSKATGTFPLPEAVRDWNATELLRKAGVAVYEPVAIVMLPFFEWSKSEGWRPLAVYVRRPRENLRVSDLDHLSARRKRVLLETLKSKIASELEGVGRSGAIADVDVIRHFVERVGRTAGLFQGGMGLLYFHGMLHDQNVSLLGEIVDVGNSDGVRKNRAAMREAWSSSAYSWWPDRLREYRGMNSEVETALFLRMAARYNDRLRDVAGGGLSEAEVQEIFSKAYREGRRGMSAADPRNALTIRATASARAADEDRLARYRRPDGTLEWTKLTRDRALSEGAGLGHFALALFLKEVAVVAATGDRARIEEFFDGLLTTDFYAQYGLFVAGARVGEVAYAKTLQRFIKPGFVNGLLKTNLVLAAGIALPLIVEGRFEGKAFAISVASLGLSSAAVKAGVASIRWVTDLASARRAGTWGRLGVGASRLARVGGWFYTAAELAVILYVAEEIDTRVNAALELSEARDALADAGEAFLEAARSGDDVAAAADAYHGAWIDYRNFLYRPLHMDEALLAERLKRPAREAKIKADERAAALERIRDHDALRADVERRHGSLEAYAEDLVREDEAALEREVNTFVDSYNLSRERHLREVYEENRRGDALLAEVDPLDWLLGGGVAGADGDPFGARTDVLARWGRSRARGQLRDALEDVSGNRMEAYDDEAEVLASVARLLRARGDGAGAALLDERRGGVLELKAADRRLVDGDGGLIGTRARSSLTERVSSLSD